MGGTRLVTARRLGYRLLPVGGNRGTARSLEEPADRAALVESDALGRRVA